MQFRPVHWTEGMFLRPQHFQASDRHWRELLNTSQAFDSPYNYGFRSVEISTEALANHQLQLNRCQARTRDGVIIEFVAGEGGQEINRLDLKPALEKESTITVYLAIPKLKLGRANLGERYSETFLKVPDETRGGGEQELSFQELKATLTTEAIEGFDTLPLARVKRTGVEATTPELDTTYIPPVLAVDGWTPLGIGFVRAIYDFIGEHLNLLSQRAVERKLSFSSQDERDVEILLKLNVLNEAYSVLNCLTFASGVHPFAAYTELCRIVGKLAIFAPARRIDDIPAYDHDDLHEIFRWIQLKLRELLGVETDAPYEQRFFEGRRLGMHVKIDSKWLHSDWEWFVGVNGNVSGDECTRLLKEGCLNWKMGSESKVDMIFEFAVPDVKRDHLPSPPSVLPTHQGWQFYKIRQDRENAAWRDVVAEETLSLRFAKEYIANADTLPGQRKLEVRANDKRAILEFALFAKKK